MCLKIRNYNSIIYDYDNYYPFSFYSFILKYYINNIQNNNICYLIVQIKNKIISIYLDVIFIDIQLIIFINILKQISLK